MGSPAINAGNETVCAAPPVNNLDQRGFVRPGAGATNCSIGAYEFDSPGPGSSTTTTTTTLTTTTIASSTTTTTTLPGSITLTLAGQVGGGTALVGTGRTLGATV